MEEVLVVRGQGAGGGAGKHSPLVVFDPLADAPVVHGDNVNQVVCISFLYTPLIKCSLECAGGSHEDVLLKQLTTTTLVRFALFHLHYFLFLICIARHFRLGRGKTVARKPVKQLKRKAGRRRRRNEGRSETHLSHPPSAQPFQSLHGHKVELHPDLNLMATGLCARKE